jgi:hypothetical protein
MTYEKCAERYGAVRPVEYRHPLEYKLPVQYVLPAELLRLSFPATESSRDTTSAGGVRVSCRLDTASNEVNIEVSVPEKVIRDTIILRDTIAVQVGCTELVKLQRWYHKAWERYKNFAAVAFLLLLYVLHKVGKKCYGKA